MEQSCGPNTLLVFGPGENQLINAPDEPVSVGSVHGAPGAQKEVVEARMKNPLVWVSILVVLFFILLSLPYQIELTYWAETLIAWISYLILGLALAVYVVYTYVQSRRHIMNEPGKEPSDG